MNSNMRVSKTVLLLIECLVSICSMKNGIKLSLKDINGFYEVHWGRPSSSNCYRGYTSTSGKDLLTCAYMDKEDNCTINSIPYELKQVNQLFVNVESSTRVDLCKSGSNKTHCKKTVDVVAYFGNDGNTLHTRMMLGLFLFTLNHSMLHFMNQSTSWILKGTKNINM